MTMCHLSHRAYNICTSCHVLFRALHKIVLIYLCSGLKDLIKDLKSELNGNVEELILALFMPATYYDAWSLHHAMKVCLCFFVFF